MKSWAPISALCCLMPLGGCGAGSLITSLSSTPDLSGNWEIASTSLPISGSVPAAGLLLIGSLTSQGSRVTGIFRLANLSLPNGCGTPLQQVVTVSGAIDSNRSLALVSAPFSGSTLTMNFSVPPTLVVVGAGSTLTGVTGTAVITGSTCTFTSTTAFGAEFVSLSGTYAGTLTAATFAGSPSVPSGAASLVLSQATAPQSDGQFPVTGTLSITSGACTTSTPLAGTVSGPQLTLASTASSNFGVPTSNLVAIINAATGQLDVASFVESVGPCNTGVLTVEDFSGNLTKQ